jgi:G3E family GTPase
MEQFCIIDAAHFLDAYRAYASLEKQIASSSVFIINKTDLASSETIEEAKKVIRQFHPDPSFFETTYADIPVEQFLFPKEQAAKADEDSAPKKDERTVLSEDELEDFIDDLLDSPDLEITPPDRLMSVTYKWSGDSLEQVKEMAWSLPASVVRAKGFVEESGKTYLFNYVMEDWTIEESEIPKERIHHKNVVVFIGPPESMEGIDKASKTGDWASMGTFQPMSQAQENQEH